MRLDMLCMAAERTLRLDATQQIFAPCRKNIMAAIGKRVRETARAEDHHRRGKQPQLTKLVRRSRARLRLDAIIVRCDLLA